MADTDTTTATPQAQPAPSPAPAAAPEAPAAPPKTGAQAIQESKGRPPGKPVSARDYNARMGGGAGNTAALISESQQQTPPQPQSMPAEGDTATQPSEGAPEGEVRTKPNRAGEPQPMDEKGKYQSPGSKEEPGPQTEAPEAAADDSGAPPEPEPTPEAAAMAEPTESQPETDTTAAADAVPEGMVRVEIPDELQRNFGKFKDVPKEDEEFFRFNINNWVRNTQVEQLEKKAREERAELERQLQEARQREIESQTTSEAAKAFKQTDEYKGFVKQYEAFRVAEEEGSIPEGSASIYWQQAVEPAYQRFQNNLLVSRREQVAAQVAEQRGQQWIGHMWEKAQSLPKVLTDLPRFRDEFDAAVTAFDFEAKNGRFNNVRDAEDPATELDKLFTRYFQSRLVSLYPDADRALKQALQARRQTQQATAKSQEEARQKAVETRAKRDAEAARRKEAEVAARNAATNPMGNVASGQVVRHAEGATKINNARDFDRMMRRRG